MQSESGGNGVFQNFNYGKGRILQECSDRILGLEHRSQARDGQASSGTEDQLEIMDGDPDIPPKEVVKLSSIPKVDQPGATKWSSLFGVKPLGK